MPGEDAELSHLPGADKILRYMNFEKFMDLLENKRLYFCRLDRFEDKFEGFYTTLSYDISKGIFIEANEETSNTGLLERTAEIRSSSYINCWSLSNRESIALWKIYGGTNSVAVETSIDDLKQQTSRWFSSEFSYCTALPYAAGDVENVSPKVKHDILPVEYIDHRSKDQVLAVRLLKEPGGPILFKNIAFQFENEVRAFFRIPSLYLSDFQKRLGDGFHVPVDHHGLVHKVVVSPYADDWFFDVVSGVMKRYGLRQHTEWSVLRFAPSHDAFPIA